jgi:hypothetical protein
MADLVTIVNGGFEDEVLSNGAFTLTAPTGWSTLGAGEGTFNPTVAQFPGEVPEGLNTMYISGTGNIEQILSDVITANTTYSLQVEVGNRLDSDDPQYLVQLTTGSLTLLAEDADTLAPANGEFITSTVAYTALPGDPNLKPPQNCSWS